MQLVNPREICHFFLQLRPSVNLATMVNYKKKELQWTTFANTCIVCAFIWYHDNTKHQKSMILEKFDIVWDHNISGSIFQVWEWSQIWPCHNWVNASRAQPYTYTKGPFSSLIHLHTSESIQILLQANLLNAIIESMHPERLTLTQKAHLLSSDPSSLKSSYI